MRVYIRDLVLPVRVGVHDYERAARQQVRFEVAVDARIDRGEGADYFSYEIIRDAITEAVSEGHIDLVETLAGRIAARILRDSRAYRVRLRVEKLEVAPGILGVEMVFDREGGDDRSGAGGDRL